MAGISKAVSCKKLMSFVIDSIFFKVKRETFLIYTFDSADVYTKYKQAYPTRSLIYNIRISIYIAWFVEEVIFK